MFKKKLITLVLTVVISIPFFLTGCASSNKVEAAKQSEINLYAGGSDNVRTTWEAVINDFNSKNPEVKVNLQFIPSGTGAQSAIDKEIAAEKAGQKDTDMDIIETSDGDISRFFKEAGKDSLVNFTTSDVPNLKNTNFKSTVGGDKAVAFRGTTVVLAYNSDKVKSVPKTDKELYEWIKKNPGRFAYNDPTTGGAGASFFVSAIYNGLDKEAIMSEDIKWKSQWEDGFKLLKELHPYMYKASGKVQYPAKNQGTLDLLANGQVDIIPGWADMTLDQLSKGILPKSVKITQITPSLNGSIETLIVPSKSKNQTAAKKFINYVISVEGQKTFLEKMKAIPVIDSSKLPKESIEMLHGLKIDTFRPYSIGDLGKDLNKRWQDDIATLK